MVQKKIAIYCRVSTCDQSCDRQEQDLLHYATQADFDVIGIWKETGSGKRKTLPERQKVINLAQARKIDAILVTELTRWGRSTIDLIQTLEALHSWDISLIAQTGLQFDLATSQGRLIAQLMAALAEFERNLVGERVRSGLAAAKARGKILGRRPGQRIKSDSLAPKVIHMVSQGIAYRTIADDLKLSKTTVTEIVKRHRQAHPDFCLPRSKIADPITASFIYQLKIMLRGIRPPIWRRVQVNGDITLENLHWVIQSSMGWTNSHLHSFNFQGIELGVSMPNLNFSKMNSQDEQSLKLSHFVSGEGGTFYYLYDFGDSWEHQVLVEKLIPVELELSCPVCVQAKRACPPEDCGGVGGYQNFLEAINNVEHPQHQEMLDWVGGFFDPEEIHLSDINAQLKIISQ
jgi:DNA invertase Pin-like site-specific DNA recombinase